MMRNIIAMLIILVASKAVFAGQGVTCYDYRNILVAEIPTTQINDIAKADIINGSPVILYNPNIVASHVKQIDTFFFWHECAHHALAHAIRNIPFSREQEADCWAIRGLISIGAFTDYDIRVLQTALASFGKGDWTHLPGPARAINLSSCLL